MRRTTMKTSKILFTIAGALALLSCSKDKLLPENGKNQFTFGAATEEIVPSDESKSELGADGLSVVFKAGESVTVFDGASNNRFITANGGAHAQFSGSAATADSYLVVSPYSEKNSMQSASVAQYVIPDVQVATPGSADPRALVTIGKLIGGLGKNEVQLTPAVALMKVTVPQGLTVKTIQIGGGRGAQVSIAGRYSFNTNTKIIGTIEGEEYKTFITLVPQAGQSTIAPGSYYVAVCPKNYEAGLVVAFVDENNVLHKRKGSKSYNIERKKIYNFGTLNTTDYIATTGKAVLRQAGDDTAGGLTGRLKTLAGSTGTAVADDNNIRKIVFHSHTLYPSTIVDNNHIVSSGQQGGVVPIYASYKDGVMDIYTEASAFTIHANSYCLLRNFAALESVTFDDVNADANTNLSMMFRNDLKLRRVDFGNCDFSKVVNMSFMFSDERMNDAYALNELKQVSFGATATTSVTNFKGMFWGCKWMQELILGHNFTVNHLADATMCNQMFGYTAMDSNAAAGSDVSKKCRLYMTQEQYNDLRQEGGTGVLSNSLLNAARFWFNPVTAENPAPGLTPEEGTEPGPGPDPGPEPTGPKFAIFGDSISTYAGYIQGYTTYYPYNPNQESNTVDSVDKTYWMQLIKKFDGALAMNISYSGSCVSYAQDTYTCSTSGKANKLAARQTRCFLERYKEHSDLGNPDIIILYGGTNDRVFSRGNVPCDGDQTKIDWKSGVANVPSVDGGKGQYAPAAGEVDALCATASENLDTDFFMHAYVVLLRQMLADHPNAKIACLVGDGMTDAQEAWIKGVCTYMASHGYQNRIKAVSFHNAGNTDGKKYDPNIPKQQASVHPNALGMTYMANYIYNELKDWL